MILDTPDAAQCFDLKYRPKTLEQVMGQPDIIESLRTVMESGKRSMLFSGEPGTGKTTICRIIAEMVGALYPDFYEVNAGETGGKDDCLQLVDIMAHRPQKPSKARVILLNECHQITTAGWQALLDAVEHPPKYGWWLFSTTRKDKVDAAILSRCSEFDLAPITRTVISAVIRSVAAKEHIELPETADHIMATMAHGSLRKGLIYLEQCKTFKTIDQIHKMTHATDLREDSPLILFCRALNSQRGGIRWPDVKQHCGKISDSGEAPRPAMLAYFSRINQDFANEAQFYSNCALMQTIKQVLSPYATGKEALAELQILIATLAAR